MTSAEGEKVLLTVGRDAAQDLYRREVVSFLPVDGGWSSQEEPRSRRGGKGGRRRERKVSPLPPRLNLPGTHLDVLHEPQHLVLVQLRRHGSVDYCHGDIDSRRGGRRKLGEVDMLGGRCSLCVGHCACVSGVSEREEEGRRRRPQGPFCHFRRCRRGGALGRRRARRA